MSLEILGMRGEVFSYPRVCFHLEVSFMHGTWDQENLWQ